jgi:hypothetical protein
MGPRHLGAVFPALSPSGLRTNQVSLLSITRLVHLVVAVLSQGVGVLAVAALPITLVHLKEMPVDLWPIVVLDGVGGKDGGIGKKVSNYPNGFLNTNIQSYSKNNRTRESSVAIDPSWQMLEEIEFHRLAKLRLEVDEPEEL